jgi:hypothetical protein
MATNETPEDQADVQTETPVPITMQTGDVDEDGFTTIWNVAAASTGGDIETTRALASRLLLFLCKKNCDFVVTSSNNAEYLTNWFERDTKLLYDWKPESEFVDVVAQHAEVPAETLMLFLKNKGFSPDGKYTATRAVRVKWFEEAWCVG